jgi:Flp pilus assembly protein TadG
MAGRVGAGREGVGRLAGCTRGSTAVEFAMLLPVFLAFVLGVVEFSRAMWTRQTLQFAVEEAARYALADATISNSSISAKVTAELLGLQNVSPTITVSSDATQVTVGASYVFAFLVPQLIPTGPLTLTATCRLPR